MQTLDAPHPNPAGCPAWARSRQPRYWAWNAAGLVGNDPCHRRPCRRPEGSRRSPWRRSCGLRDASRDGVRDAAGGLRDRFDRIGGISGFVDLDSSPSTVEAMAPIVPNSLTICAEVGLDGLEFALHHRD